MVEAKSKIKQRHEAANREFQDWLARNPEATREEKISMFNLYQDRHAKKSSKNAA